MFSRQSSPWPKTYRINAVFAQSGKRFDNVLVCATPLRRARGLLFRAKDEQALLWPCASVHSFGMGQTIDVIYLSRGGDVVKIVSELVPWRTSAGGKRAYAALEVRAGDAAALRVGERVSFDTAKEIA